MRDISLGIMIGVLICMCILTYYPITETDQACYNCGAMAWYFKLAKENK